MLPDCSLGPESSQYKNYQSKFSQHDNVPQFSQCQTIQCIAKNTCLVHKASLHERLACFEEESIGAASAD